MIRYERFNQRIDPQIYMSQNENFFKDTDAFSPDQGFAIAVAYMNTKDVSEVLDPKKGELAFYLNEWGYDERGEFVETYEKVPHRKCTDQDLGLDGGKNAQFFPMSAKIKEQVEEIKHLYQCIDSDVISIMGSYDSSSEGRMIYIRLTYKCEVENECTEQEISRQMFKNNWLQMISNRIRFDSENYGESAILKEVDLSWLPIQTQIQQQVRFSVVRQSIMLQDRAVNLDEFTLD